MQQLWELKVDWDDPVPEDINDAWLQWKTDDDTPMLLQQGVPSALHRNPRILRCLGGSIRSSGLPTHLRRIQSNRSLAGDV